MQEAMNKNTEFNRAIQSLTAFLINMPNNEVWPGESVSQIYAKQHSQLVSIKFYWHGFKMFDFQSFDYFTFFIIINIIGYIYCKYVLILKEEIILKTNAISILIAYFFAIPFSATSGIYHISDMLNYTVISCENNFGCRGQLKTSRESRMM